ncbi:(2Fe-2S)-binding protein [Blastochloris viridis]|uniref:BFD-like [2Fe-2S] binding domain protein n=1 Tax=Blastochloris viridis TaxID=1079 RepID=A0A0H5BEG9_BLAVI|nr:(2Fe-2S)-binding protein [Blastochloris viridis]ALK10576.1 BFD-like [2Fe-2S] binding domain protein [Blastochloris viridis]BAR99469.1 hypothetical protein BV133_1876 [Blastochloris viridis]CUU43238.1 BFD-like [2Fe-2S] binding domain protein [Blastochloris viridis]
MIVCSCNVLSDRDIRSAAAGNPAVRTVGDVFRTLGGCDGQCHRCARSIKAVLDEAKHSGCDCNGACHQDGHDRHTPPHHNIHPRHDAHPRQLHSHGAHPHHTHSHHTHSHHGHSHHDAGRHDTHRPERPPMLEAAE